MKIVDRIMSVLAEGDETGVVLTDEVGVTARRHLWNLRRQNVVEQTGRTYHEEGAVGASTKFWRLTDKGRRLHAQRRGE